VDLNELFEWLVFHALILLVGAAVLLLAYRLLRPAIPRVVPSILRAQAANLPIGTVTDEEFAKRSRTIADLLTRLLRVGALLGLLVLVVGAFDLWTFLAGIALIVAAVTVASQDVVLDYVMGFLILVEGPFFEGDWVVVGGPDQVEGEVRVIGLRRTVLRDKSGSSHAVSNGLLRLSSNQTRVFSVAAVEVVVPRGRDLDAAIAAIEGVIAAMHADPAWSGRMAADVQPDISITALTVDGVTIRTRQRVSAGARMAVASEIRHRLVSELLAKGVDTSRWDTPLPVVTIAGTASASAAPA
jgi:small-conductance mechanosensitive channel